MTDQQSAWHHFITPDGSVAGDLRIVDRLESNGFVSGALQVFIDGAFGAVCASNFGAVDADVACKQLGFVGGAALPLAIDRRLAIGPLPVRLCPLLIKGLKALCG